MTIVSDYCKWPLFYKYGIALDLAIARVTTYASRSMLQIVASLTIIIYNCNMFIVEATAYLSGASETEKKLGFLMLEPDHLKIRICFFKKNT